MINSPTLLADIGATNARLAFTLDGKDYLNSEIYKVAEFSSLYELCSNYINNLSEKVAITKAIIGVAAPVTDDSISFVNIDLSFSQRKIKELLFPDGLVVLNDMALQAHSLIEPFSGEIINVGSCGSPGGGSKILIIPGTGLGLAGIVNGSVVSSEAGHVEIPSILNNKDINKIIDKFKKENSRSPTFEDLLSGKGINFIYRNLSGNNYFNTSDGDIFISNDKFAVVTIKLFINLFAVYLRYMTLEWNATGGVYISGNIVNSMMTRLDQVKFREIFEDSNTMKEFLIASPIYYIKDKDLGFKGGLIISDKSVLA